VTTFADQVRGLVYDAMDVADITQAELARRVGITPVHASRVLTGRGGLSLDLAEEMLRACGRRPVVGMRRCEAGDGADG
jgi:plasmid maintenance system antidote protein VapI